jgi:hypothetical protein
MELIRCWLDDDGVVREKALMRKPEAIFSLHWLNAVHAPHGIWGGQKFPPVFAKDFDPSHFLLTGEPLAPTPEVIAEAVQIVREAETTMRESAPVDGSHTEAQAKITIDAAEESKVTVTERRRYRFCSCQPSLNDLICYFLCAFFAGLFAGMALLAWMEGVVKR